MKHIDPLSGFLDQHSGKGPPLPLRGTSYVVEVRSGLAVVDLYRRFRNDEDIAIEATLTFPVPFDAVVLSISARIGERVLTGKSQAKSRARASYEQAIDDGMLSVLHEELFRGLHMLSVANLAPQAEIEVKATFVLPVALANGDGRFRIPVTVGQIYGQLPLPDLDDLLVGGPAQEAEVTIRADRGSVLLNGTAVIESKATAMLDRPIEIDVLGLYDRVPSDLRARAADGRRVTLHFEPEVKGEMKLDVDILIDASGSMGERLDFECPDGASKWTAVLDGLARASRTTLSSRDLVSLWTFSNSCVNHGQSRGDNLAGLLHKLPFEGGGTELARSIVTASTARPGGNFLLITDGRSGGMIDAQAAIATGARFTVVLVGEDALEVNVGYLAAMTGGQMFLVHGAELAATIDTAVQAMRHVALPVQAVGGRPDQCRDLLAGTEVSAKWGPASDGDRGEREHFEKGTAAFAASLAIRRMTSDEAAGFAAAEGLVTHLTSIVLTDEAAESVQGVPATRKILLASSRSSMQDSLSIGVACRIVYPLASEFREESIDDVAELVQYFSDLEIPAKPEVKKNETILDKALSLRQWIFGKTRSASSPFKLSEGQSTGLGGIDWDYRPDALERGDLSNLPHAIQELVRIVASLDEVMVLATGLGQDPVVVALALLAESDEISSRTATRFARRVLSKADSYVLEAARAASADAIKSAACAD